ncbi:MAG: hypothetical protein JRN35_05060 [Nitrososphaerota archaeon]|jgi:hypothetical protein|nr:hypothetical protein [Nitrososphaerota archaeon]
MAKVVNTGDKAAPQCEVRIESPIEQVLMPAWSKYLEFTGKGGRDPFGVEPFTVFDIDPRGTVCVQTAVKYPSTGKGALKVTVSCATTSKSKVVPISRIGYPSAPTPLSKRSAPKKSNILF